MKKLFAAAIVAATIVAAPVAATPIVYTFTGTFAGVNGGPFENVFATFTGTADTNNVLTNGYSYYTQLDSLQAVSPTAGTFNITDPSFFYININGFAGLEFGAFNDASYFSGQNDALLGYQATTSFATVPIAYFDGINATFNTDRGSVTITSATDGTFGAALGAVPEPATWSLMIAGFGLVGFAMRKRTPAKMTVTYG